MPQSPVNPDQTATFNLSPRELHIFRMGWANGYNSGVAAAMSAIVSMEYQSLQDFPSTPQSTHMNGRPSPVAAKEQ